MNSIVCCKVISDAKRSNFFSFSFLKVYIEMISTVHLPTARYLAPCLKDSPKVGIYENFNSKSKQQQQQQQNRNINPPTWKIPTFRNFIQLY